MSRLVPVALVVALLLPAAALAGTRYRCLYTGETSDHCKTAEAPDRPIDAGTALERVCCEALASPFVAAPARVESSSQSTPPVAHLPVVPAPQARPRAVARPPEVVARAGPARGLTPAFLLHCSLQL